ncbi:cytochrome P450 78A9-like [Phragmites australis]|uniref:cytochrome P450 78A9-like n=1 Tax=Phragmites australis TaxID=29695 RepID=UPI002D78DD5D|nr:cytochrome P450 78A9-like [Phragmites australis]
MATPDDCGSWLLYLSLAAKCGGGQPHRLAGFLVVCSVAGLVTCLLHWCFPGGPAWGKWWWTRRALRLGGKAVPGPRGLPVIGSMWLMTGLAHRNLAAAAESLRARRLMAFSLGETRVVVAAHPDVAREILNSPAFADRPVKESAYGLLFHRAIGFAPHGAYWRALRRVASTHLFSPWQVSASGAQRAVIARQMVGALAGASATGRDVQVRSVLRRASLHNVMWSVFGRRYDLELDPSKERPEARELRGLVDEGYDLLGQLNWSDHLPWLARFDLQSIRARCSRLVPRVNRFVGGIIDEHRSASRTAMDFTDVLLSLQGDDRLADSDMVAVLWEMVFRGTDTVAVLIEWVLARLVLHPDVQARVHDELDRVVGPDRAVTESDSGSLVYLHAVIKEVLRLHPPGPLLSWARLATSDVHVDGFLIPAGTTAMVNMWAITHDPDVWANPTEFRPDRFAGAAKFPVMGSDLRLAPFGAGRRSCPGKSLAMATVAFWLATLLHELELLPSPDPARGVDLSEVLRLSCEMSAPLAVTVRPRRAV